MHKYLIIRYKEIVVTISSSGAVQIITVNPSVRIEDKAHRRKTINPWERRRICFLEDLKVGNIQHGPIAAESSATLQKTALMVKQDWILITKWSELEPYKEWTKAEANAFPVVTIRTPCLSLKRMGRAGRQRRTRKERTTCRRSSLAKKFRKKTKRFRTCQTENDHGDDSGNHTCLSGPRGQ